MALARLRPRGLPVAVSPLGRLASEGRVVLFRSPFAPVLLVGAVHTGAGRGAPAAASTQRAERPAALAAPAPAVADGSLPQGTGRAAAPHVPSAR